MLWQRKPSIPILFIAGVIVFLFLVIDTHRLRRQRSERYRILRRLSGTTLRRSFLPCACLHQGRRLASKVVEGNSDRRAQDEPALTSC